jgi:hypothetical protein
MLGDVTDHDAERGEPEDNERHGDHVPATPSEGGLDLAELSRAWLATSGFADAFTRASAEVSAQMTPTLLRVTSIMSQFDSVQLQLAKQFSIADGLLAQLSNWQSSWAANWNGVIGSALSIAATVRRLSHPENWWSLELPEPDLLQTLVLEEGLPLCWIPPVGVLERLLAAQSAQQRRDIIGRSYEQIMDGCEEVLNHVTSYRGRQYARFVRASIRAIREGHRDAGQSLATNTLDTLVTRYGLNPPAKNKRPELESMDFRDALVLGALWRSYFSYRGEDPTIVPPREFLRHATAHAVSSQQYSLRNATLAVMHLVAVLRWLEIRGFVKHPKGLWRG